MYNNEKLNLEVEKNKTSSNLPRCILSVLSDYYQQRAGKSINPFNILVLKEMWLKSQEDANTFLNFLYENNVRSFIINDSSTSLLSSLAYLLSSNSYSISLTQGYNWKGSYEYEFGIVVEIKRKRVKNC